MRIRVDFANEPFSREVVLHTLRHLAMRRGWQLVTGGDGDKRILYATTDAPESLDAGPDDIVILSSARVAEHLANRREPFPVAKLADGRLVPFPHPARPDSPNRVIGDVIAGAYAAMNLWYEQRTLGKDDRWITWRDDWMSKIGLDDPMPLADQWLDEIAVAAERLGWAGAPPPPLLGSRFAVVLTHDVDYLPGPRDLGLPRLGRALARQVLLRRKPGDALKLIAGFAHSWRRQPYLGFESVFDRERQCGACSSFQVVVSHVHRFDPDYAVRVERIAPILKQVAGSGWEICLHSSYTASRISGQLQRERAELERIVGAPVMGHRQHYLNFSPVQLIEQVEQAGLAYDLSVGYNDRSGPRAGTYFPYRPFKHSEQRSFRLWEIPFVLMDTTLATTYRLSPRDALEHAQAMLSRVARAGGCVSIIWHLEQLSGLVDPGFDRVYYDLLDWIRQEGGALTTGRAVVSPLDARWSETLAGV